MLQCALYFISTRLAYQNQKKQCHSFLLLTIWKYGRVFENDHNGDNLRPEVDRARGKKSNLVC